MTYPIYFVAFKALTYAPSR